MVAARVLQGDVSGGEIRGNRKMSGGGLISKKKERKGMKGMKGGKGRQEE